MVLTLLSKHQEAGDVQTFLFQPDQPLSWIPGQYLKYTLNHPRPDNRGLNRYFSIASAPSENVLQISTRIIDQPSSFKQALANLQPGQTIESGTPIGEFTYQDPSQPAVFIAGGIGITPYRSILMDLDHQNLNPNIILLYANRGSDIPFKDLLDDLSSKHPNLKVVYHTGNLDANTIKQYLPDLATPIFYISGPEPMVEAVGQLLENQLNIPKERVKQDFFPGYSEI